MSDCKTCSKCGEVKALDDFYSAGRGYLASSCRRCHNDVSRAWRASNHDRNLQLERARREKDRELFNQRSREWHRQRPEANRRIFQRHIQELSDTYVLSKLKLPAASPELISLKREQLFLLRLTKQLKQEITNQQEKSNGN